LGLLPEFYVRRAGAGQGVEKRNGVACDLVRQARNPAEDPWDAEAKMGIEDMEIDADGTLREREGPVVPLAAARPEQVGADKNAPLN
jgi:hypothetical protein